VVSLIPITLVSTRFTDIPIILAFSYLVLLSLPVFCSVSHGSQTFCTPAHLKELIRLFEFRMSNSTHGIESSKCFLTVLRSQCVQSIFPIGLMLNFYSRYARRNSHLTYYQSSSSNFERCFFLQIHLLSLYSFKFCFSFFFFVIVVFASVYLNLSFTQRDSFMLDILYVNFSET